MLKCFYFHVHLDLFPVGKSPSSCVPKMVEITAAHSTPPGVSRPGFKGQFTEKRELF